MNVCTRIQWNLFSLLEVFLIGFYFSKVLMRRLGRTNPIKVFWHNYIYGSLLKYFHLGRCQPNQNVPVRF